MLPWSRAVCYVEEGITRADQPRTPCLLTEQGMDRGLGETTAGQSYRGRLLNRIRSVDGVG
jgi:hypothetical protein